MTKGIDRYSLRMTAVAMIMARSQMGMSTSEAIAETIKLLAALNGEKVSRASLYRWLSQYQQGGWQALQQPHSIQSRRALSDEFVKFLSLTKKNDPRASIPEIIRRAREASIIGHEQRVDRTTVYRQAMHMNLPLLRQKRLENTKRPFCYPHRMQMVLCDGKHFRAGAGRLKRMAYFFLDDATRYILGVIVGTSENPILFLQGLFQVISTHGLMDHLYLDKGSGFIAETAARVARNLGIPFIFGATRYPEGHGKIERFNRTCKQQCLRGLAKPGIDPTFCALRLRILHYTTHQYGKALHEGLNQSPESRFYEDSRSLRFPESEDALAKCFVLHENRKVRNDNVIPFNDLLYEVPLGYAGTRISVFFNTVTNDLSMIHNDQIITLRHPDLTFNARERRMKTVKHQEDTEPTIITAAEMSFNKEMRPIVDRFGGYPPYNHERKDE